MLSMGVIIHKFRGKGKFFIQREYYAQGLEKSWDIQISCWDKNRKAALGLPASNIVVYNSDCLSSVCISHADNEKVARYNTGSFQSLQRD